MYGVTKQAVHYHLSQLGIVQTETDAFLTRYRKWLPVIKRMAEDEGAAMIEVKRTTGLCHATVTKICKLCDISFDLWQRPGCPRCKTEPYARGLCRPCYAYAWRHGLLDGGQ